MSLAAGQSLSFYEILGPLGAGGMGEVYRARDTRLEREVAIKVLPEELADDDERLRRFEREAKTLASLNHPNVAGIHGVDQQEDVCFLALELVPGEDLATRLRRGPLAVDEAIEVCRQVAEGLEAAHEAGVVHRDLKPANVRLTPDGVVKLLDFGLAKPIRPKSDKDGTTTAQSDSFLMTEEGLVLGTPTYMSPEQARGKPVDRRTDIWAFGCVLYECLTGQRAFRGDSFTDVLASIVGDEPDWSSLPALPPRVSELLTRTLTKDPRERLRDVGEARMQLQLVKAELSTGTGGSTPLPGASVPGTAAPGAPVKRRFIALATVGLALVLGYPLGSLVVDAFRGEADPVPSGSAVAPARHLDVQLAEFDRSDRVHEARISPDGTHVAWAGKGGEQDGLFVRTLGDREARQLQGVDGDAVNMFVWSPDSRALAYVGEDGIWTIGRDGRGRKQVYEFEDAAYGSGLVWQQEALTFTTATRILRLPVVGGEAEVLLSIEEEDLVGMTATVPLPGDRGFLCVPRRKGGRPDSIVWRRGEEERTLLTFEVSRMSDFFLVGDQLLFVTHGEEEGAWRTRLSLDPVALSPPVRLPIECDEELSVADDGTITYLVGDGTSEVSLCWLTVGGSLEVFGRPHEAIVPTQLSRDRREVLYSVPNDDGGEIWVHDLERGFSTQRLHRDDAWLMASFLPDGRLAVASFQGPGNGETRVYPRSGRGDGELLFDRLLLPIAPDSTRYRFSTDPDWAMPVIYYEDLDAPTSEPVPVFENQEYPQALSRSGEWMLYSTESTGERQLHLGAFPPDPERDWIVTAEGGRSGWFDEDRGRLLFTRVDDDETATIWSVSCELTPDVRLGRPVELLEVPDSVQVRHYDPDNDRFLATIEDGSPTTLLRLVTNWGEGGTTSD